MLPFLPCAWRLWVQGRGVGALAAPFPEKYFYYLQTPTAFLRHSLLELENHHTQLAACMLTISSRMALKAVITCTPRSSQSTFQ